mgnify:FL=1
MDNSNNTGNYNTGNWNTGDCNTGNRNTGNRNTGYRNTGYLNTRDWNTGNYNTGDCNTGNWNTGDWNTGYLNTDMPLIRIFGKETEVKRENIIFPDFFWYILTEWIEESAMTDKEKEAYPSYVTCKGYLKSYTDKQAWRNSFEKASKEDKEKCFALPNWNNEMFKEISGIDVEKELKTTEHVLTLAEIAEKFGLDVKNLRIKE